jgi:nicotinamide-nucleotide amidase
LGFLLDEPGEILVILTAREQAAATARKILHQAERAIREKVGPHWVGDAEVTLSAAVGALLLQRGQTLAVAESCTGGWLAHRITSDPGCSAYFHEGVIAYCNDTKIKRLKVPQRLLKQMGAVSEPVALAMAEGVRSTSGADWGVATTGIAGPGGGTQTKPVGTVCLACAGPRGARWVQTVQLWGERHLVQQRAATLVLDRLRRILGDKMQ